MPSVRLTIHDRITLALCLYHQDEKGKSYEARRRRRRVAECAGIRKGHNWDVFAIPGNEKASALVFGLREDPKKFIRAKHIGDRRAELTEEAIDELLSVVGKHGGSPEVNEEWVLDVEEKLHALKDGKNVDGGDGLPGIREPSVDDDFIAEDEDETAEE